MHLDRNYSTHPWIHGLAVGSCNIDLDPAIRDLRRRPKAAIRGRRRPKAAIGQRPRYGGRRPASGRVEPAEYELVQRRQFIQVRNGPFDPPLCVPPLVCPSDAMFLPSSAIRHVPWRLCVLPKCPVALTNNRKRFLFPTLVRYFWAQEQQPFPGASQRRPLPGNAHPATLSPSTSTSLSRPRGSRELTARASSAGARLSVVFFLRARYILASFVFIE